MHIGLVFRPTYDMSLICILWYITLSPILNTGNYGMYFKNDEARPSHSTESNYEVDEQ